MNNKEILKKNLKYAKKIMTYLIMEIGLGRCWLYQWRAFLQDELSYIQLEGGFHSSNLKLFQCSNLSDSFVDFVKLSKWQIVPEVESCYKNYKEISKIKAQQTQLTYIDTLDQIRMIPAQEKQKQRKRNKFLLSQSKRKVSKGKRKYGEQKKRVVEGKQQ